MSRNMNANPINNAPYNLYSNESLPAARAIATTPLVDLMHHASSNNGVNSVPPVSSPMRSSGYRNGNNRLWNSGNPSYSSELSSQNIGLQQRQFCPGFNSSSAGFSSQQHLSRIGSNVHHQHNHLNQHIHNTSQMHSNQPLSSSNAMSMRSNLESNLEVHCQPTHRNDDSRMIDSLFGDSGEGGQTSNLTSTNNLITGFNSLPLSVKTDTMESCGLWGTSKLTDQGWEQGTPGNSANNTTKNARHASSFESLFSREPSQECNFDWNL